MAQSAVESANLTTAFSMTTTTTTALLYEPQHEYQFQGSNENANCYVPPIVEQVTSATARDFILALYIFTGVLSFASNGAVILVQLYGSESSRSIRKYLNSLAVSDILLVFTSMPATYSSTVLGQWIYPGWFCRTSRYFQLLGSFVTSATLTIIGIER